MTMMGETRGSEQKEGRPITTEENMEKTEISEKNPRFGSRGERGEKVLNTLKHQLRTRKQRNRM